MIGQEMPRIFMVALLLVAASASAAEPSKSQIDWKNRSDELLLSARQTGKPFLVEVWADWCQPCRRMDREVWSDPRIIAESQKFVCLSVDVSRAKNGKYDDAIRGLHGNYPVHVIPTFFILDPWGEVILVNEGFIGANEFAAILREMPSDYTPVRTWREALVTERDNSRALQQVGLLYQKSMAFGVANRYYREALQCGGAREDESLTQELRFGVAMNEVRRADWRSARKSLEEFLNDFPNSNLLDQVILGFMIADVKQGKLSSAQQWFEKLKATYPNSDVVPIAGRLIAGDKAPHR
jgi:thiol-disulfide isomerase/thioredoxin